VSIRLSVGTLLFEPLTFYLDFWREGRDDLDLVISILKCYRQIKNFSSFLRPTVAPLDSCFAFLLHCSGKINTKAYRVKLFKHGKNPTTQKLKQWALPGTLRRMELVTDLCAASTVVAASSSNVFKQILDCVDLAKFCL